MDKFDEKAREVLAENPLRENLLRRKFAQALRDVAREVREEDAQIAEHIRADRLPANATWDETALAIAKEIRAAKEAPMSGGIYEGPHSEQLHGDGREVTPPGVESGSGPYPVAWMVTRESEGNHEPPEFFLTKYAAKQNACLGLNDAQVVALYQADQSMEGSGHECAARKAIDKIKARLPKRIPSGEPIGEGLIDIALIVNAALSQPCPSGMTRDQAEKIAEVMAANFATVIQDPETHLLRMAWTESEMRTEIADALQKVVGSEDTQRLDTLEACIRQGTIVWDGVGDFPGGKRFGLGLLHLTLRDRIDRCLRAAIESEDSHGPR